MRASEERFERTETEVPSSLRAPQRVLLGTFALHDFMMLGYLAVVRLLLASAAETPTSVMCTRITDLCIVILIFAALIGRTIPGVPDVVRKVVYRATIVGLVLQNYLILRYLLPMVRPDSVDATLLHIDETIFGVEPALALEVLNVRPVVEWFSFFYFSYFFICGTYMLVAIWLAKPNHRTTAFGIGTLIVYCVGQLGYMAVPGFGPHEFLATRFQGPINGGFFWTCVWDTVQAGSAMKDIFPSLHTAGPLWFALHAWNNAKEDPRWKIPAIVTGFFSANIIFSTVFLRWHYAIDVLAGLTLAITASILAPRLALMEEAWRTKRGFKGAWILSRPRLENVAPQNV